MKISEFAKATGLSPRAVRLYEEKGLLQSQRDPGNKYRSYHQNQVNIGKKINDFRKLGFSVSEVRSLIAISAELDVEKVKDKIEAHLVRLNFELDEFSLKVMQTKKLLTALNSKKPLNKAQKDLFQGFSHAQLKMGAVNYANQYLKKEKLGHDEELQLLACTYANLYLVAAAQGSMKDFATSHKLISKSLTKIGEDRLAQRHLNLSKAYQKM